jgi:hypothetical protein
MVDIRGEWDNSIQKFCLIGDIVTYLVGVAEKEPSDFLVEQGLLVGTTEYVAKSHVLKRKYEDEDKPLRLDARRRLRAIRPGRTVVSVADRGAARRRDCGTPVMVGRSATVCVTQRRR